MFNWFRSRMVEVPIWKRILDNLKYTIGSFAAIAAALASLLAYVWIDTTDFKNKTDLKVASNGQVVLAEWSTAAAINEEVTLIYIVNGKPAAHYHFHELPTGSFSHIFLVPFGTTGELDLVAIWEFKGITTGFVIEPVRFVTQVPILETEKNDGV